MSALTRKPGRWRSKPGACPSRGTDPPRAGVSPAPDFQPHPGETLLNETRIALFLGLSYGLIALCTFVKPTPGVVAAQGPTSFAI